ncbi:hypothetical protein [Streptomyces sp. NPDC001135]
MTEIVDRLTEETAAERVPAADELTPYTAHGARTGGGADGRADNAVGHGGPYTTVHGRIWPYARADAAWYRFRLVNASNARIFELVLTDAGGNPCRGRAPDRERRRGWSGSGARGVGTAGFPGSMATLRHPPASLTRSCLVAARRPG